MPLLGGYRGTDFVGPLDDISSCLESDWRGLPARDLFIAVKMKDVMALEQLIKCPMKARTSDLDCDGFGGLLHMIGLGLGEEAMIDVLDAHGADVDHLNKMGVTALIVASCRARHGVARRLLERGASVGLKDWAGRTALAQAEAKSDAAMVSILKKAMAPKRGVCAHCAAPSPSRRAAAAALRATAAPRVRRHTGRPDTRRPVACLWSHHRQQPATPHLRPLKLLPLRPLPPPPRLNLRRKLMRALLAWCAGRGCLCHGVPRRDPPP